jgi:hypothetical protein
MSKPLIPIKQYLTLWLMLACFVLVLMLTHQSENAVFLGRYSESYALNLGILFSGIIVALACLVISPTLLNQQIKSYVKATVWVSVLAIITFTAWLSISDESGLFRLFLIFSIVYWGIYPLQTTSTPRISSWVYVLVGVSVCIAIVVIYIGRVPAPPIFDEPLLGRWAVYFFRTGNSVFPTHLVQTSSLLLYPMGAILNTLGITYLNARLTALILILMSLPFIYLVIQRYFGRTIALFAMLYGILLALQQSFFRVDALIPLYIAIGIACYEHAKGRFIWYALSGFAFASTLEAHLLGVVYGVGLGLICTYDYARQIIQKRQFMHAPFWGLLSGGIVFVVFYFLARWVLFDISLQDNLERIQYAYQYEQNFIKDFSFPDRVPIIFVAGFLLFVAYYPLNFLVISTSLALYGQLKKIQLWLGVLVLGIIIQSFINPKDAYSYYYVHMFPLLLITFAGLFDFIRQQFSTFASVSLMAGCIIFSIFLIQEQTTYNSHRELIDIGSEINTLLPPEAKTVLGWEIYYWGLHERDFYFSYAFMRSHTITVDDPPPVKVILEQYNIPPADAIILTSGKDDTLGNFLTYIQENQFERAQCFDAPTPNREVILYVRPDLITDVRNVDCP